MPNSAAVALPMRMNHELGGADEKAKGYTFNYEARKAPMRTCRHAFRLDDHVATGEERLKGEAGKKVHTDAEAEGLLARV